MHAGVVRPPMDATFPCGVCGQVFDTRIQMDQHNQTTHGTRVTLPSRLAR